MTSSSRISTPRVQTGTLYFVALLNEELGRRVKTARVAAGMTQRELADAIHLKNSTDVSRYERGITEIPSHRIDLIAEVTGRPRSYFTRDPSEAEAAEASPELEEVRQGLKDVQELKQTTTRIEEMLRELLDGAQDRKEGA